MARTKVGVGGRRRTKLGIRDAAHQPIKDLVGRVVLDRYRIDEELGAGAMGTVYRGEHVNLNHWVAIKVLHAHFGQEPTMLARFRREAKAASRLRHPNIAGVLDVGTAHGRQIMVLEFAAGPTLAELIGDPLPADRVIHVTGELLRALEHAHTAGVVHRDLKPENIIVATDSDGRDLPRIVDFGIAALRESEDAGGPRLTASGVIIGTPAYMAPEQAQADAMDHRVDLFSIGVIAYEMLAGEIPFDGSAMEVALAYISKDPPAIANRAPGVVVPPALEAFVRKLMARRAADRFATAQLALDLLELLARDPAAAERELAKLDAHKATAVIGLPPTPVGRKKR